MEEKITFSPGSFFHGTKADLKTGNFLTKGFVSNYADRTAKYVYSREQRAKWLLADIWRLPRGSNTPLLCIAASLVPRCMQRGL